MHTYWIFISLAFPAPAWYFWAPFYLHTPSSRVHSAATPPYTFPCTIINFWSIPSPSSLTSSEPPSNRIKLFYFTRPTNTASAFVKFHWLCYQKPPSPSYCWSPPFSSECTTFWVKIKVQNSILFPLRFLLSLYCLFNESVSGSGLRLFGVIHFFLNLLLVRVVLRVVWSSRPRSWNLYLFDIFGKVDFLIDISLFEHVYYNLCEFVIDTNGIRVHNQHRFSWRSLTAFDLSSLSRRSHQPSRTEIPAIVLEIHHQWTSALQMQQIHLK